MKKFAFAIVVVIAGVVIAKEAKMPGPVKGNAVLSDVEKAAKKAAAYKVMLEKTGGIFERPGEGRIVVVNCQQKISAQAIKDFVVKANSALHVNFDVVKGSWKMGDAIPSDAKAALYIVEDSSLPMSLIAPEAQWGVLNVKQIDEGPRFNKAMARAVTLTFGAGTSQAKNSPMQTVRSPEDLDAIIAQGITMDAYMSIMRNLKGLGVTQSRKTSYRKACMEGWAAAPTNDYQKVIWEEIHAKPTNPMKIKFDPKKGE